MVERTFDELARDVESRRRLGDKPPVLLLGAGASVESGIEAMDGLFRLVNCPDFEAFTDYIATRTEGERYRLLADFLQTRDPAEVTDGYRAVAALCAANFFDIVLSTNLDPLLGDALAAAELRRKDYLLMINGVVRPDRIEPLLLAESPRVKVLKLHGDLFHRFMAWTPAEMEHYLESIREPLLHGLRDRDVLVVGHSLRDDRIRELVFGTRGVDWYVTPGTVPDAVADSDRVRAVVGSDMTFETLFARLAEALGLVPERGAQRRAVPAQPLETTATTHACTMDDFVGSIVGICADQGEPSFTGFVIAEPRVIVTDGWTGNIGTLDPDDVTVVGPGSRRLKTRFLRHATNHPFGPLVLEVPSELTTPGLVLEGGPLAPDQVVHAAVAAGTKRGVSSGKIVSPAERTLDIAPIGPVPGVVELALATAPGSSGAPVIDAGYGVRGFIVAGSTDPDRPQSYMLPASAWGGFVRG